MLPSLSLSSSPNSSTVKVDKATSELLIAPDWTMNMEICDAVNSDHWTAKEVVKSVKKRLQHKSPRVQLLTLTLLETMVKNCGEQIHFHIAERKILDEMIKIVKKRTDMQVRSKVLSLIDSWQEAFGGSGGKHMQYYLAYDELRRSGVQFPPRSLENTAPIITPPASHPSTRHPQIGFGMPNNSSRRLDEAMASDSEGISVSMIESMRSTMELLAEMLLAVDPSDRTSVEDEVLVDIVDRCRSNQKKLMQMLTTTTDEELLGQGLELNDAMQAVLAKRDAIASGSPIPARSTSTTNSHPNESPTSNIKPSESRAEASSPATSAGPCTPPADAMKGHALDEEEDDDDEFAQLARRHSRPTPVPTRSEDGASSSINNGPATPEPALGKALVLADPPATLKAEKEQDMADFLSIVLSTSYTSEPEPTSQAPNSAPVQNYSGDHVQPTFNSYVAPWAQDQSQPQHSQYHALSQSQQPHQQMEAHFQPQQQSSAQPNSFGYPSAYPPPPWAATPGYANGQVTAKDQYIYSMPQDTNNGPTPMQDLYSNPQPVNGGVRTLQQSTSFPYSQSANQLGYSASQATMNPPSASMAGRSLQHMNSFPARGSNAAVNGSAATTVAMGQQPYIPSYKLFEDLNVFGNEGKTRSGPYSSASGTSGQSTVGGSFKYLMMEGIIRGRGKNKRFWSAQEDDTLLQSLLELSRNPKWKSENGFKPGYMNRLEEMILAKLPECGLKAKPHIESRLKH